MKKITTLGVVAVALALSACAGTADPPEPQATVTVTATPTPVETQPERPPPRRLSQLRRKASGCPQRRSASARGDIKELLKDAGDAQGPDLTTAEPSG